MVRIISFAAIHRLVAEVLADDGDACYGTILYLVVDYLIGKQVADDSKVEEVPAQPLLSQDRWAIKLHMIAHQETPVVLHHPLIAI